MSRWFTTPDGFPRPGRIGLAIGSTAAVVGWTLAMAALSGMAAAVGRRWL